MIIEWREQVEEVLKTYSGISYEINKNALEREIEEYINQLYGYEAGDLESFERLLVWEYELSLIVNQLEKYNEWDEFEVEIIVEVYDIEIYDIDNLLKTNNIPYEKSRYTESIYLNDGEIRISTHKRPSYEHSGVYYDHQYEKEYIVKTEKDMYELIKELIEKGII